MEMLTHVAETKTVEVRFKRNEFRSAFNVNHDWSRKKPSAGPTETDSGERLGAADLVRNGQRKHIRCGFNKRRCSDVLANNCYRIEGALDVNGYLDLVACRKCRTVTGAGDLERLSPKGTAPKN